MRGKDPSGQKGSEMAYWRQYPEMADLGWVVDGLAGTHRAGSLVWVKKSGGEVEPVILGQIHRTQYGNRVGTVDHARTGYYRKHGTRRRFRKGERAKRANAA